MLPAAAALLRQQKTLGLPLPTPDARVEPTETGSAQTLQHMNATHGVDGVVFCEDVSGPSAKAVLTCGGSKCELYMFGAHIVSWQASGVERMWMSGLSKMDGSAAIRGGVPIAFPQFADAGGLPLHGFARTSLWRVVATHHGQPGTSITLGLSDTEQTRAVWPHKFELAYTVTLTPLAVAFELSVINTDSSAWDFTGCLHTYLRFKDTKDVEVHGLAGAHFVDKCDSTKRKLQVSAPVNASHLFF